MSEYRDRLIKKIRCIRIINRQLMLGEKELDRAIADFIIGENRRMIDDLNMNIIQFKRTANKLLLNTKFLTDTK